MCLGKMLADFRYANRMGVRELAKEIGLSSATLNRIENGKPCNGDSIAKLMIWLFTDAAVLRRVKSD